MRNGRRGALPTAPSGAPKRRGNNRHLVDLFQLVLEVHLLAFLSDRQPDLLFGCPTILGVVRFDSGLPARSTAGSSDTDPTLPPTAPTGGSYDTADPDLEGGKHPGLGGQATSAATHASGHEHGQAAA